MKDRREKNVEIFVYMLFQLLESQFKCVMIFQKYRPLNFQQFLSYTESTERDSE